MKAHTWTDLLVELQVVQLLSAQYVSDLQQTRGQVERHDCTIILFDILAGSFSFLHEARKPVFEETLRSVLYAIYDVSTLNRRVQKMLMASQVI